MADEEATQPQFEGTWEEYGQHIGELLNQFGSPPDAKDMHDLAFAAAIGMEMCAVCRVIRGHANESYAEARKQSGRFN